ncbi:uncharacterized protein MONOS_7818 [Monocercomonoides exilis]|uniref:uncharacterized protein n=1 Tax=Monocercomonoides exilis TaxID=2049356 RepID=UPI003559B8B6|nr:hypothetical protein MONOS_7818 [Monocercomonoides exilis]|eukprot:MONOS_7818.1-p1 / transcript=MONOS_7818.1 / gene=MONOS_7818 / organism=Monocercomonoides_exilis_PA203 / gene_product=unspecified product / transcript_product=unspecified product / location=Mono_scaffold00277:62397-62727(+) / protein_length=93 / sequence_SO=supercontig / SO=protein_coding / is_pseudo=false
MNLLLLCFLFGVKAEFDRIDTHSSYINSIQPFEPLFQIVNSSILLNALTLRMVENNASIVSGTAPFFLWILRDYRFLILLLSPLKYSMEAFP